MATIQGVYLALFGRPADPTGLAYFNGVTNNGANLSAIGNLATQAEYTARFTGLNNLQIINSIYQSLFGRDADVTGLNFFANQLATGRQTINTIAINILDGATGTDKTIVDNKIAAANLYTAALDTGSEIVAYSGTAAADAGRSFIQGVTTTVPTQAAVDTAVATMVATAGTGANSTFSLTTGQDYADNSSSFKNGGVITSDFKFSAGNQTVTAAAGTLGNNDALIDASTTDNDTLNATLISGAASTTTIQNIENLAFTVNTAGSGLDFANVTGAKTVSVSGGANSTFTGVSSTATPEFTLLNYGKAANVQLATLAGTTTTNNAESLKVTLSGTTKDTSLTVASAVAGTLETLNLVSGGSAANISTLVQGTNTTFGTINVTGTQALTLKMAGDQLNNVKIAATNTGATALDVDIDGGDLVNLGNVTGVTALTVRDSNAPGTGGDGFSLFNVATGSTITLATDANAGVITVKGAAANTADTVNFVLKTDATAATDINLTSVTLNDVETINFQTDGAPTTGANKTNSIGTLNADSLTNVKITGASEFTTALGSIAKNITVDASAATSAITIDGSAVTGAATGTKTLAITGGAGADVFTASTQASVNTTLAGGAGNDKFIVGAIGTDTVARVSITDLAKGDIVQFGGTVAGTVTNKLGVSAAIQAQIEGAATVKAAAELAATSTGTGIGDAATTANTAYIFTYKGDTYAFLNQDDGAEAAGGAANSYVDATDAIIKIVGVSSTTAAADMPTFTFA